MQRICAGSVSTHALRGESDLQLRIIEQCYTQFQSTPSARRATATPSIIWVQGEISIHALREEGDMAVRAGCCCSTYFNPRPPRGGRRWASLMIPMLLEFQSTPSARRATVSFPASCRDRKNFNPRPPRGGRPGAVGRVVGAFQISIHALREEGDFCVVDHLHCVLQISIHALREEGDRLTPYLPRHKAKFQSTPSARRATGRCRRSSTAARYFNPRPPRGGRLTIQQSASACF